MPETPGTQVWAVEALTSACSADKHVVMLARRIIFAGMFRQLEMSSIT